MQESIPEMRLLNTFGLEYEIVWFRSYTQAKRENVHGTYYAGNVFIYLFFVSLNKSLEF